MNGWDLAEVLFPVLGMVAAVNLLIQFFQIAYNQSRTEQDSKRAEKIRNLWR